MCRAEGQAKSEYCGKACETPGDTDAGRTECAQASAPAASDADPADSNPMTCDLYSKGTEGVQCSRKCMCAKQLWVFYYFHPM